MSRAIRFGIASRTWQMRQNAQVAEISCRMGQLNTSSGSVKTEQEPLYSHGLMGVCHQRPGKYDEFSTGSKLESFNSPRI